MSNKTDLELIPEVARLRELMRETRLREGKLVVEDLPAYVNSLKSVIPIYQELKDREHYKVTARYVGFKLEMITEVLKNNYGIELSEKK
jgi:hypothetical protein